MKRAFVVVIATLSICAPAYADGVDIVPYFTRVASEGHSTVYVIAMMVLIMAANYVVNFIVIGLPAVRIGRVPTPTAAKGLIALTVLGQIADRIGALLAALLSGPVAAIFRLGGEGAWVVPLLALNFLFSGLAVAALALYFLRRRWAVQRRVAWIIAVAAGVITNPAWIIGVWLIRPWR